MSLIMSTSKEILTTIMPNNLLESDQNTAIENDIYDPRVTRPFAIICLFIGSIGNSLSFIVFTQKQLRVHSTFRYLAYLSVVDLIVLYLGLGNLLLRDYFHFNIREYTLWLCRSHTYLTYVSTHLSSWILTLVSIDRAVACTVIKLNKSFCRPKSADRIFFLICMVNLLINSHILLFMGSKETTTTLSNNGTGQDIYQEKIICTHNTSELYFKFFERPYSIFDLLSYVLIPFIIMTICAGIIAYRLFFSFSKTSLKSKARRSTQRAKQISYMLLVLNFVFVILLSPIVIGQIFQSLNEEHRYRVYNSITIVLSYSNHALNFVLYGITSPQFRLTLKELLGCSQQTPTQRRLLHNGLYTSTAF